MCPIDKHHILAKSNEWTNHPDNIKALNVKVHRNIHNLFGNLQPHSQIDRLLDISYTAWLEDRVQAIDDLFRSFDWKYYKDHCIRKGGTNYSKKWHLYTPDFPNLNDNGN